MAAAADRGAPLCAALTPGGWPFGAGGFFAGGGEGFDFFLSRG